MCVCVCEREREREKEREKMNTCMYVAGVRIYNKTHKRNEVALKIIIFDAL